MSNFLCQCYHEGLDVEPPHWASTLNPLIDVEATLVFSAHNKSNPHFVSATPSGLHSGGHGFTFVTDN